MQKKGLYYDYGKSSYLRQMKRNEKGSTYSINPFVPLSEGFEATESKEGEENEDLHTRYKGHV